MTPPLLEARACCKTFGPVVALDGLSFAVQPGEIFALLGPNGAGKTTMVRMLTGIQRPDSGSLRFCIEGEERWPRPSELGYLPEERGLYGDLSILRNLEYFGRLRGMERESARSSARAWLERLELGEREGDKVKELSKGNQQKVQLIAAVLHAPLLAVLDEPFSGLDPLNQEVFLDLVRDLRESGTTVVLSAHQMHLVERLADRVLLVARGREVLSGSVESIKRQARERVRLRLRLRADPGTDLLGTRTYPSPPSALGIESHAVEDEPAGDGKELVLHLSHSASLEAVVRWVGDHLPLESIRTEEVSLHDIYVQRVRQSERTRTPEDPRAAQ